jgi:hypothetical protein
VKQGRDQDADSAEANRASRMIGANPLHPNHISAPERLAEIAEILATGLMRLMARKSSHLSPHCGESSLDCAAHQSGHADRGSLEVEA